MSTEVIQMDDKSFLSWLVQRKLVYRILGILYYKGPKDEVLEALVASQSPGDLIKGIDNSLVQEGWQQLYLEAQGREKDMGYRDRLWNDYNQLFVGPGSLKAPPWESVYRSKDRIVFGPETLAVRKFFQSYGLEVQLLNKEPDDHIGLELEFMAYLSEEALAAYEAGEDATDLLEGTERFLHEHLEQWVPNFCDDVEKEAQTDFFVGLAKLTRGWLEVDAKTLAQI